MQRQTKKVLTLFPLVMINVIAVDNLGTLPIAAAYGSSLIGYYLLAALVFFIPSAVVTAELATGWPHAGGLYAWIREAFGPRLAFVVVWIQWVYNIVWYPKILSFIAAAFAYIAMPALLQQRELMWLAVLALFALATWINCRGLQSASRFSTLAALLGTMLPMLVIIILGGVWLAEGRVSQVPLTVQAWWPTGREGDLAFFSALLYGLIGLEMSGVHAPEVVEPGRTYPRALLISVAIILSTLLFGSLAIALVVPAQELNVVVGLTQAFDIFFRVFGFDAFIPFMTIMIILGGFGSVAAWVIGPTKSLLAAAVDGCMPPVFCRLNARGAPVTLLWVQASIFFLLSTAFLLMPTVQSSYWLLTTMSAQLGLLVYVALFAAFIRLRYLKPEVPRSFTAPGGLPVAWLIGGLGMSASLVAIALGFAPPHDIPVGNVWRYEVMLVGGAAALLLPPWLIYALRRPEWCHSPAVR